MSNALKVISSLLIAFIFAGLLFFFLTKEIDSYIYTQGYESRGFLVQDTCSKYDKNESPILLLGSSTTVEDINGIVLEKELNHTAYNFGMPGTDPVLNSLFIDCFLQMKPKTIIYTFTQTNIMDISKTREAEIYALLESRIAVDRTDERYSFLSEEQKNISRESFFEKTLEKRKFIIDYLFNALRIITKKKISQTNYHDLKNPTYIVESEKILIEKHLGVQNEILAAANFSNENNTKLLALSYLINRFKQNNVSVILVNTPLHPYVLMQTNISSADYFDKTLTKLCKEHNCTFINDFNKYQNVSFFFDHVHLSFEGKDLFTKGLSKELSEKSSKELSNEIKKKSVGNIVKSKSKKVT